MTSNPPCGAEYIRPGGRQRGDRIVRCDLPAGHTGAHEEIDTGSLWSPAEVGAPLPGLAQEIEHDDYPGRPLRELSESGLLWLINAVVFHPRGYALALAMNTVTGEVTGWDLLGDGREPWRYADDCDDRFAAAEATLRHTSEGGAPDDE